MKTLRSHSWQSWLHDRAPIPWQSIGCRDNDLRRNHIRSIPYDSGKASEGFHQLIRFSDPFGSAWEHGISSTVTSLFLVRKDHDTNTHDSYFHESPGRQLEWNSGPFLSGLLSSPSTLVSGWPAELRRSLTGGLRCNSSDFHSHSYLHGFHRGWEVSLRPPGASTPHVRFAENTEDFA